MREPRQNNTIAMGKLPPSASDVEEKILGAIMLMHSKIPLSIFNTLHPNFFYSTSHQIIFKAIQQLRGETRAVDISTVIQQLRFMGELERVGGAYALTELTNKVANSTNIERHVLIIHQMFLKRELIRIGTECARNMYEDTKDPLSEIKEIGLQLRDLEKGIFRRTEKAAPELMNDLKADRAKPRINGLIGHSTGFQGLDYVTHGFRGGQLIVIPAATGSGKSILMCNLAINKSFDKNKVLLPEPKKVLIFSLEMMGVELSYRLISNISGVPEENIKTDKLMTNERQRVDEYQELFEKSGISIDDTAGININELEVKIAIAVANGCTEILIDYFQLIVADPYLKFATTESGLNDVSKRLKTLAKDLNIPIILFSQVTDEVKKRYLRIPESNDIMYCKALANDADVIIVLWRADYNEELYNTMIENHTSMKCPLFGELIIDDFERVLFMIVKKNRGGKEGRIPMKIRLYNMQISDHYKVTDALEVLNKVNYYAQEEITNEERDGVF